MTQCCEYDMIQDKRATKKSWIMSFLKRNRKKKTRKKTPTSETFLAVDKKRSKGSNCTVIASGVQKCCFANQNQVFQSHFPQCSKQHVQCKEWPHDDRLFTQANTVFTYMFTQTYRMFTQTNVHTQTNTMFKQANRHKHKPVSPKCNQQQV